MIARREEEIRQFVPRPYFGIRGESRQPAPDAYLAGRRVKERPPFDRKRIEELVQGLQGKQGVVEDVKRTPKKTYAPLLYDLTELQRDANKRFGYSAKETLNIMRRPVRKPQGADPSKDRFKVSERRYRTDAERKRLRACGTGPYKKLAGGLRAVLSRKSCFSWITAGYRITMRIIPTEQFVQLDHMTVDERRIYDLVVRRFLAVLYPPFEYEQTALTVKAGNECFTARGEIVKASGWREAYENEREEEEDAEGEEQDVKAQKLPDIKKEIS